MKILENVKDEHPLAFFWQIIGPLFILCTYAVAPQYLSLFLVGIGGLFLSARWKMKGFCCSLVLLGVIAFFEYASIASQSLWFFGIEGSYTTAFLITALCADRHSQLIQMLSSQLEAKSASISYLEEEFSKACDQATAQRIQDQEKIGNLQKTLEEGEAEHSSLLVLNDVLRKMASREGLEKTASQEKLVKAMGDLKCLQEEVARLKSADQVILENTELKSQIALLQQEANAFHLQFRQVAEECEQYRASLKEMDQLQKDRLALEENTLKDQERLREECVGLQARLDAAEAALKNQPPTEEFLHLQGKVKSLVQIESLYKQLKVQFEEKNQILHETRASLFHTDTALQALKIDLAAKEFAVDPFSKEIDAEISEIEERSYYLEEENKELHSLVTSLLKTSISNPVKRKKKVKTNLVFDQPELFS